MDKHTEKSVHGGDVYRNQVELDFSVNINPFGMPDGVKKALGDAIFLCTQYPDESSHSAIHSSVQSPAPVVFSVLLPVSFS